MQKLQEAEVRQSIPPIAFPLPIELTLPQDSGGQEPETDEEYARLVAFVNTDPADYTPTEEDIRLMVERDWVPRLIGHLRAVNAFVATRCGIDTVVTETFNIRSTKTRDDDSHSLIQLANTAVLMSSRALDSYDKAADVEDAATEE